MGLCGESEFLRLLPTSGWRRVWTWKTGNGTVVSVTGDASTKSDCLVELVNLLVAMIVLVVAIGFIVGFRRANARKRSSYWRFSLLPLHATRTVLCLALLLFLILELSESIRRPLPQIFWLMAALACWFLHRESERRGGDFGLIVTVAFSSLFAAARIWRLFHLLRTGLTWHHARTIGTAGTIFACISLAIVDIRVLHRTMRKRKRYEIGGENWRVSYRHSEATLIEKLTFHWVVDLLKIGYRRPLEIDDLGQLPRRESSVAQLQEFRKIYDKTKERGRVGLWACCWKHVWRFFAVGGVLKLLGDAASLVGPLAVSRIIDYAVLSSGNSSTNSTSREIRIYADLESKERGFATIEQLMENGYFVGFVMFFAAICQSTLSQASTHLLNVEGIRLRTALQALVYEKSLCLYSWSVSENDDVDPDEKSVPLKDREKKARLGHVGALTNLMAEDVCNVMSFFWIGHYTWAIPVKIVVIIYLVYRKLGMSAILGAVGGIAIVTPLQLYLGKKMSANLARVAEKSDARLSLMNQLLQAVRLIKLRAWEKLFESRVKNRRDEELGTLDLDSIYWALISFLTHASSILITLLTFGIYFWLGNARLEPSNAFASLALFSQLSVPLLIFPVIVPIIINSMISIGRLEDFLSLPEIRVERRCCLEENDGEKIRRRSVLGFGKLGDIDEEPNFRKFPRDEDDDKMNLPSSLVRMEGDFCWVERVENPLRLRAIEIPRGKLTIVVGKTGSGKTYLISALLGEAQSISGRVEWSRNTRLAFVSQKPWLLNATLKDNVLFGAPYRPRRYRSVLGACALQPDVEVLPGRDLTRIGENGINLSGGQKQRIAIARAIYSDAEALIMDDPFAALDQQVGRQIFENAIKRLLLRKGRTVVMVTHRLEFLSSADYIVAMEGCAVRASGTKASIELSQPALAEEWREGARKPDLTGTESHKTAKERWSLVRLVSRIGISLGHSRDGSWSTDRDVHVVPPSFVPLRPRRSSVSGSRCLAHDLTDLPVPVDEWALGNGRRSRRHRVAVRSTSLQPPRNESALPPPPVIRQSSTPTILESHRNKRRSLDNGSQRNTVGGAWKQLFFGRGRQSRVLEKTSSHCGQMHSGLGSLIQNPAKARSRGSPTPEENRERSVLRRLVSSSSSTTSNNNRSRRTDGETGDPSTLGRFTSTESTATEDALDEQQEGGQKELVERSICEESGNQDEEDEGEKDRVTKKVWVEYWLAGGLTPCLGYFGAALGCQALRIYTDLWLSRWTELGIEGTENLRQETFGHLKMYVVLSVGSMIVAALNSAAGQWAGARSRKRLHEEAIAGLLGAPLSFFEKTPIGKILNGFSVDTGIVDKKLSTGLQRLTWFVLLCASAILVNVVIAPWFALAAVPICSLYYFLQRFYRRSARELQRLEASTRGRAAAHFSESLGGLTIIRASGQQTRFTSEMMERLDANTNAFLVLNTSSRWLGIALDYLGAGVVLAATYAALFTAQTRPDRVGPSLVGLAVNYTLLVPIYLNWVVKFLSEIEMYMASVARLASYAKLDQEDYRENGLPVAGNWPKKGEIIFQDVSLAYDLRAEPVVEGLNLSIPAGQKLGICGRTASGKSSTVMALFRLVHVSHGRITIDGVDINEISLTILRSRLSAIPQDVAMFGGSVRENLDPTGEHSDEELWRALEVAQIKSVVACSPEGLELELREGGDNFSSGELQLLCMARAILKQSSVVILDEATSSLDSATEKKLLSAIMDAFKDKTLITIAHRVASLMECDRVIVFDGGRIVEEGSPMELARRPMGFFTAMLRAAGTNDA